MSDVGVLTLVPAGTEGDQGFRNHVAEVDGRLRFILQGWLLNPVFGGEPFHPTDRVIDSLALGRRHAQHVLAHDVCVLVLVLPAAVDARLAAALVRYVDTRTTPRLPVFLLAVDERGHEAHATALRVAGEIRALGRDVTCGVAAVREDDPRFVTWVKDFERVRDDTRKAPRATRFRADFRRHHHLAIAPGEDAPRSWRLPALAALARHGATSRTIGPHVLEQRMLWISGRGGTPLDPRLELHDAAPGATAAAAAALAVRDLADEDLATTVTLGRDLPGGVSAAALVRALHTLEDPGGRCVPPVCIAVDDDAGAFALHLAERATLAEAAGAFVDPQQIRLATLAEACAIATLGPREAVLRPVDPECAPGRFGGGPVTAVRVSFGVDAHLCAAFESDGSAVAADGQIRVPLPVDAETFAAHWPADRVALVSGRHAARLATLARDAGFEVSSPASWVRRTRPSDPPPSE